VEDRAIPGHWEGDLLAGGKNSYIATLASNSTPGTIPGVPSSITLVVSLLHDLGHAAQKRWAPHGYNRGRRSPGPNWIWMVNAEQSDYS
jgi:hypothetical protein